METDPNWVVRELSFDPAKQHHHETIFTIGNGYLCTRGTFEEGYPGDEAATFIHGVFEDTPVFFTELVNAPNWTAMEILIAGERFSLADGEILAYERRLDLRDGLLVRQVRWRSPSGRTADLRFERFASLSDPHRMLVRFTVTPLDFSGEVEVRAGLDAAVHTLRRLHWEWLAQSITLGEAAAGARTAEAKSSLHLRTQKSGIEAGMALRFAIHGGSQPTLNGWDVRGHPTLAAAVQASKGEAVAFEKLVSVYTSRDVDQSWTVARASIDTGQSGSWEDQLEAHRACWQEEWEACDVVINGDEKIQLAVRLNLFHLLIAAPRQDGRVSIGAKTLSGFAYRGHVFWDTEIFILPFFTYTNPRVARNLLSYRFHTLPGARRKARSNGFQGAQYAWESAATGDEVTPVWVPHYQEPHNLVRIWTGDIEIHISADIAYAILQYWHATGDDAFLLDCGLEIVLETARFWASRAEWDETFGRYQFNNVIGPDEYHDHVNNNAFTNYIVRWHLLSACDILGWIQEHYTSQAADLTGRLEITPEVVKGWKEVAEKIYLPLDRNIGLIEQFDRYFELEDVDFANYPGRSQSMQALLGIDGVNQTQVLKQPDVLMLLYLLPELFDESVIRRNYDYYKPRTDYAFGSSVGPAIQSILSCRVMEIEEAYQEFSLSAFADLYDVRGNAGDGIHAASAGGLWQAIVFGFAGVKLDGGGFTLEPRMPAHWTNLEFPLTVRGKQYRVKITRLERGYDSQILENS